MKTKATICLCTLSIGREYKEITKYGRQTKILYAQKHGYDFKDDDDVFDKTRHPAWSKILLILRYIKFYDYIIWIDADTLIMNYEITITELIQKHMLGVYDIMVAQDWKMINTGVIFIKNTNWSYGFLAELYANPGEFSTSPNYEQNTFIDFYESNTMQSKDHIHVLPLYFQNEINSYYFTYYYGNFILHFCGCKLHQLAFPMNKYCPIKMEEDTEETFGNRLYWLEYISRIEIDKLLNQGHD